MDIALHWDGPYDLRKAPREGLIYALDALDDLDEAPGVYVFARVHGPRTVPLYIGQAGNVRKRIRQQLNNLKLMRGLENAPTGHRTLHVAWPQLRQGQQQAKVLAIVESALIATALSQGFGLVNVQGTKTLAHRIESRGNREAREWLPGREMLLRRGA